MPLRRLLPIALIVALLLSYVPLSSAAMPCCASAGMKAAGMQMAGMADGAMAEEAAKREAAPDAEASTATMQHCHMSASKAPAQVASKPADHIRSTTMAVCQQAACVAPTRALTVALFSAEPPHTALFLADDVTIAAPLSATTAHTAAPSPPPLTQRLTAPLPLRI